MVAAARTPTDRSGVYALKEDSSMKALASLLVLSFAVVVATPAFAGGDKPKTQAECAGAKDMIWDDATKTCVPIKK
jgi:hypothetical protein